MVAPSSAGASFDVLLQFSMDEEAQKRVQTRVSTINEELERIEKQAKKSGQAINQAFSNIDTKTGKVTTSVTSLGVQMAKLGERAKTGTKQVNDSLDGTIKKFKQLEEAAKRARTQSAMISGAAARGAAMFGQGLAIGSLVIGGAIAESNRYAKEEEAAGRATRATREWTKATEELARARGRVDNVLLKETLPLLQQAAKIASQVADFVEKNPEIVQAGLKIGVAVAGLSAIGLAVTKGIKLVADTAYTRRGGHRADRCQAARHGSQQGTGGCHCQTGDQPRRRSAEGPGTDTHPGRLFPVPGRCCRPDRRRPDRHRCGRQPHEPAL